MKRFFLWLSKRPIYFLVFTFFVFWAKSIIAIDPDFGWRLSTGKLMIEKGIPYSDPFSYTMPSYAFVDHAWVYDLALAFLYPRIGKIGLGLISTIIVFAAVIISLSIPGIFEKNTKNKSLFKLTKLSWLPLTLSLAVILPYSGIRAQAVSWLMAAILLRIILDSTLWKRLKFYLPLFFIFWANLHGSFILGPILAFTVVALRLPRKEASYGDLFIVILSFFATLVNPYGLGLWKEAFSTIFDPNLRFRINEWMPSVFVFDISQSFLLVLSTLLLFRYRKIVKLELVFLFLVLLIQALTSRRLVPVWILVALPLTSFGLALFSKEIAKIRGAQPRFDKFYNYTLSASLLFFLFASFFTLRSYSNLAEGKYYPAKAVVFLRQDLPQGNIFSEYGWGGYLIWKLPEKKVFIDGRMPIWKNKSPFNSESSSAMDDYLEIVNGEIEFEKFSEKYSIDTVLWPTFKRKLEIVSFEKLSQKLGFNKGDFNFLKNLEEKGWSKIYEDSSSVVFRKGVN